MRLNKILQKDYTLSSLYYQIKLPLDVEILIPADDPVRLLSAFVEEMELSDLYQTYGKIKKNQATPRQLFKIIVYAGMNRIYSSRYIETACRRDINFMYLPEGKPVPDHATFARFISLHFAQCSKKTLAEVSKLLYSLGEISGKSIFIDGTKIESVANKYTFCPDAAMSFSCFFNSASHLERMLIFSFQTLPVLNRQACFPDLHSCTVSWQVQICIWLFQPAGQRNCLRHAAVSPTPFEPHEPNALLPESAYLTAQPQLPDPPRDC